MTGWSGGYGDSLDVSEVIREQEEWLARTSRFLVPVQDPDVEDIAQEGRIAMWKAAERYDPSKGPADMWLKANARWRMKSVRGNRAWTGRANTSSGGQPPTEHKLVYLSDLLAEEPSVEQMLSAADLLSAAEWAYHHAEIADAMTTLTPRQREYVYVRFWMGRQGRELALHFGYEPHALWTARSGARERLRARLGHLATV